MFNSSSLITGKEKILVNDIAFFFNNSITIIVFLIRFKLLVKERFSKALKVHLHREKLIIVYNTVRNVCKGFCWLWTNSIVSRKTVTETAAKCSFSLSSYNNGVKGTCFYSSFISLAFFVLCLYLCFTLWFYKQTHITSTDSHGTFILSHFLNISPYFT